MRFVVSLLVLALAALLAIGLSLQPVLASGALQHPFPWLQRNGQLSVSTPQSVDPATEKLERAAQKERNAKRQQDIRQDSEKLLELATELKQYVDKTNENIISIDVIRKAEQIEKLAKNVKEKMKAP
jgi:hypothetical protein